MRHAFAYDESSMPAENAEYNDEHVGHPIVYWPGWVDNDARYSVQTDINPIPISPVHFQQWPGMQYQLSNGWQETNYGKRASYDSYRRMLTSSLSNPNNVRPRVIPGEGRQPTGYGPGNSLVSQKTLQNTVLTNNESSDPTGFSKIGRRTFYG